MRFRLFIALLAGLAGCMVGPDYHAPKVNTPAQWTAPLAGGVTNAPATETAWWKSFHDPELESLIVRAASSNLTRQSAVGLVRQARAMRTVSAADLGPTVSATGSYERERYSKHGYPPLPSSIPLDANIYQAGFDASWEIDVFGGKRRAIESANALVSAAEFAEHDILVIVLAEVARDYIDVRTAQQRLAIAQKNIKAQEDILAITRDRFAHGLSDDLDVQRAATILSTTQAAVPELETDVNASIYALSVLIGQPPGALADELSRPAEIPGTPPVVPVGLPSDLLLRRPDVRAFERVLAAATAQIGVATADLFPKFSLTGVAGLESVSASDWFGWGSRYWTFGPTVQWRIFDAGRIRGNIEIHKAIQEQILATYEQTVLGAFQDTENALTAYAKEQIRRQSLQEAVKTSTEVLHQSNQLYTNGLTSFLDVLDAERTLYQAEDQVVQSDSAVSLDLVMLYKALGGGWEMEAKK
jgi:NodT family efflux transporter outer membrane factor (OMF) lipoprotein